MSGPHALILLADWLDARSEYNRLNARCWEPGIEPELSQAALRVLRTYGNLEALSGKDVRRWAAEAVTAALPAERAAVGGTP